MIIPSPQAQVTNHLPIAALTQLIIILNKNSVDPLSIIDFSSKVGAEVVEFMNRCLHLSIISSSKELQTEFKEDFALWKKSEKNQNLFYTFSDSDKFINLLSALKVEYENNGYISPMSTVGNFEIPDFVANVIVQLSLKYHDTVVSDFKIEQKIIDELSNQNYNMDYVYNTLVNDFDWDENSFTNGCGKLDIEGYQKVLKPIQKNFFKSIFIGQNKGLTFFLETYFPEKRTVISFHPQKLDSTMFPKDKEIWESYFLMESIFLGFNKVEVDILGLPLKKLKVEKDNLTPDDFFNTKLLLLDTKSLHLVFLNIENMKVFRLPKIIFYACSAIKYFVFEDVNSNFKKSTQGPWG